MAIANYTSNLTAVGVQTSTLDLTRPTNPIDLSFAHKYTDGTGANEANEFFSDTQVLASASVNLDLAGGLTNAFGSAITFVTVKELTVRNKSTTAGQDLTLSGSFLDNDMLGGGSSTVVLGPSGTFFVSSPVDGFTVTPGTGDVLTLTNAVSFSFDIAILGTIA